MNLEAVVGTFNQEKALVGAFSVIIQLHRLIVCSTNKTPSHFLPCKPRAPPVMTSLHHGGHLLGKMKSVFNEFMKNIF